jgi:hypothetical protein
MGFKFEPINIICFPSPKGLHHLADTLPPGLTQTAKLLDDILPADVAPNGGCCLLQVLGAAVYAELVAAGGDASLRLAEEWCGLDVADLYREEAAAVVAAAHERVTLLDDDLLGASGNEAVVSVEAVEDVPQLAEVLVSGLLLTPSGRTALKV